MNDQLLFIKAKKFGVRLAGYRQSRGLTIDLLSQWTCIPRDELERVEQGQSTLSLPEIELIAKKLGVTTQNLLEGEIEAANAEQQGEFKQHYAAIRDRLIALSLRKTRIEKELALEIIADRCGISASELEGYESGSQPIPWPILEVLCSEYGIPVESLAKREDGKTTAPDQAVPTASLPEGLAEFVQNPGNLPYLELARKLSELDAAKLRSIAEGLLEITY